MNINKVALNTAALAYQESEVAHGSGSYHDNAEAAIIAYHEAVECDVEFASSTAVLGIGDAQMAAVQDTIEQRITGNGQIREKTKKFFDDVLCEMLDGFESHFAYDTRWNLDSLIVKKASLLVDAILRGDETVMESFVRWSWHGRTRKAVLEAIGDYAARAEVEKLEEEIKHLKDRLKWSELR